MRMKLRRNGKYLLWIPAYLLSFLLLERLPMPRYWATQLPLDGRIPFCEWFVIPYCLWYFLLAGVGLWLLLRDEGAFRRYMLFLTAAFFISEAIWLLFPNGQELRPLVMPRDNPLTALVSLLYQIDTNTNVFPSVHVVGSIGAALAVRDSRSVPRPACLGVELLAALICLSTVFIKQHSLLDAAGGILLSAAAAQPIYRHTPALRLKRRTA